MTNTHELHIRRGVEYNTDPQRRCYNGCYASSEIVWSEWEHWMDYPSLEHAERAARVFARDTQQFKVIEKEST